MSSPEDEEHVCPAEGTLLIFLCNISMLSKTMHRKFSLETARSRCTAAKQCLTYFSRLFADNICFVVITTGQWEHLTADLAGLVRTTARYTQQSLHLTSARSCFNTAAQRAMLMSYVS